MRIMSERRVWKERIGSRTKEKREKGGKREGEREVEEGGEVEDDVGERKRKYE